MLASEHARQLAFRVEQEIQDVPDIYVPEIQVQALFRFSRVPAQISQIPALQYSQFAIPHSS